MLNRDDPFFALTLAADDQQISVYVQPGDSVNTQSGVSLGLYGEIFNRNVWVHAFHEPDPKGLIDLGIPVDHIMFGSDFPHPEGMGDPLSYSEVVKDFPLERYFRDARAAAVMAPTTDVLYEFIGKALLGIPLF